VLSGIGLDTGVLKELLLLISLDHSRVTVDAILPAEDYWEQNNWESIFLLTKQY
jgi:hypothetical protein